ncbi:hypothetical protein AMTRI_Chr02g256750 [Amborella trichopoda]
MRMKLVPDNSAGTVTAYYLSSQGQTHDEIDFEFLGNLSGDPYTLHTNVFSQGKGNREQQFHLWFDPTKDFHTYSILWNPNHIKFSVDGTPIKVFKNAEHLEGLMNLYSIKTDWSQAPFVASYFNFEADACVASISSASSASPCKASAWLSQEALDTNEQEKLKWVQKNYMVYNYCTDTKRFPHGLPPECSPSS